MMEINPLDQNKSYGIITDLGRIYDFPTIEDKRLDQLYASTANSYLANFFNISTNCNDFNSIIFNKDIMYSKEIQIARIFNYYILEDSSEIIKYLQNKPYLNDILLGAAQNINKIFGFGTKCRLTIKKDSLHPRRKKLWVYISNKGKTFDNLFELLHKFDISWFVYKLKIVNGELIFDIDM